MRKNTLSSQSKQTRHIFLNFKFTFTKKILLQEVPFPKGKILSVPKSAIEHKAKSVLVTKPSETQVVD